MMNEIYFIALLVFSNCQISVSTTGAPLKIEKVLHGLDYDTSSLKLEVNFLQSISDKS